MGLVGHFLDFPQANFMQPNEKCYERIVWWKTPHSVIALSVCHMSSSNCNGWMCAFFLFHLFHFFILVCDDHGHDWSCLLPHIQNGGVIQSFGIHSAIQLALDKKYICRYTYIWTLKSNTVCFFLLLFFFFVRWTMYIYFFLLKFIWIR